MAFYNNGIIPGLQANVLLAQIDENYNPESDNAQSGKAVAQALSSVVNDKYELIETIEVTEEGVSAITRNTEPDGAPYSFKDVFISVKWNSSKEDTAAIRLNIKSGEKSREFFSATAKATTNAAYTFVRTLRVYNHILCVFPATTTNLRVGSSLTVPIGYIESEKPIDELTLAFASFPIGAVIEIWGVRA